jgi:hypothetical protein
MDPVHPPSPSADPAVDDQSTVVAAEHDPDIAAALAAEQVANDYHPGLPGER